MHDWEDSGEATIVVKVPGGEQAMLTVVEHAENLGLLSPTFIRDAGRTEIEAGSLTVVSVGPAPVSVCDLVTGSFRLLK